MEAAHIPWRPLGELFVDRGLISRDELETALQEQAATGKRLGEILVDLGLVSGPDLTSVLMDQLGVEISKEEGYGSGLWAEIKRRHKRVRSDDADDTADVEQPELALVPDPEEAAPGAEVEVESEVVQAALEEELQEIKADYTPPAEREPAPVAEGDDAAALRAELEQARADLAHLQGMLADAMTALTALSAEVREQQAE